MLIPALALLAVSQNVLAGSTPKPTVDISWVAPSTVQLSWTAVTGRVYSVESSADLSTWKTVGLGNMDSLTDSVDGVARKFYRVSSNAPPELAAIGDKKVRVGEALKFSLSASDPDGDALSFGASNVPQGAVFDPQTSLFSWTPTAGQEGTYASVRFSVSDAGNPKLWEYEEITITVGSVPPEIIVTWPRGGQRLEAGDIDSIEWVSKGEVGETVHIDFTPDGGATWYVIKETAPNIGYYNWVVPDFPSDDCWVAVWSEDESVYGLTDDAFTIHQSTFVVWSVYLVAGDGQYLGDCTTDILVWDSIWNELGPYGSVDSWTSIWNPVSVYGSDYSDLSPWDRYALDPPYIFVNDQYIASLSTNYLISDAVHPEDFFDWVEWIGY